MKKYIILISSFVFAIIICFSDSLANPVDEYKYVKEVNGVRIYYAVRSYSPKPGKAAKKIVFKLKNSTKTAKTLSFKVKISDEKNGISNTSLTLCLKPNEENLKKEITTEFKEVKTVQVSGDTTTDGGC